LEMLGMSMGFMSVVVCVMDCVTGKNIQDGT